MSLAEEMKGETAVLFSGRTSMYDGSPRLNQAWPLACSPLARHQGGGGAGETCILAVGEAGRHPLQRLAHAALGDEAVAVGRSFEERQHLAQDRADQQDAVPRARRQHAITGKGTEGGGENVRRLPGR